MSFTASEYLKTFLTSLVVKSGSLFSHYSVMKRVAIWKVCTSLSESAFPNDRCDVTELRVGQRAFHSVDGPAETSETETFPAGVQIPHCS